jgi:hypothetical protein
MAYGSSSYGTISYGGSAEVYENESVEVSALGLAIDLLAPTLNKDGKHK